MKIKFTSPTGAALLLLAGLFPTSARSASIMVDAADAEVVTDTAGNPVGAEGAAGAALNLPGAYYAGSPLHYVAPLQLPSLGPGTFINVSFTVTLNSVFKTPTYNVDVYGVTGTRATAATALTDATGGGTFGSLLVNDLWTSAAPPAAGTAHTTPAGSGAAFSTWLNTEYANGANAGSYAFVRFSPDAVNPPSSGYFVRTANDADPVNRPFLTYDFIPVPEPSAALLSGIAALGLLGSRRRRA